MNEEHVLRPFLRSHELSWQEQESGRVSDREGKRTHIHQHTHFVATYSFS